jgi:hypothetical protein
MPIEIYRFPGEAIVSATAKAPLDPEHDVPAMFAEFIPLRLTIPGKIALIIDFGSTLDSPDAFSNMVMALSEASRGIRAGKQAGVSGPPITIFVGSGPVAAIASQAVGQDQYGGVRAELRSTMEEALALARARLAE